MESTPTKKSALKSFLVLAGAVTVGYIVGTYAVSGINSLMSKMTKKAV